MRTKVSDMQLIHQDEVLTLKFDCKPCEMHIIGKMKGHILHQPQPGSAQTQSGAVGYITPEDLIATDLVAAAALGLIQRNVSLF